jgi:hypothetical protein
MLANTAYALPPSCMWSGCEQTGFGTSVGHAVGASVLVSFCQSLNLFDAAQEQRAPYETSSAVHVRRAPLATEGGAPFGIRPPVRTILYKICATLCRRAVQREDARGGEEVFHEGGGMSDNVRRTARARHIGADVHEVHRVCHPVGER